MPFSGQGEILSERKKFNVFPTELSLWELYDAMATRVQKVLDWPILR